MFYFGTIAAFSVVGFVVGKYFSDRIEVKFKGIDSKTTWTYAFGLIYEGYGYATLYTKNGDVWWGYLRGLPDVPDPVDVIILQYSGDRRG